MNKNIILIEGKRPTPNTMVIDTMIEDLHDYSFHVICSCNRKEDEGIERKENRIFYYVYDWQMHLYNKKRNILLKLFMRLFIIFLSRFNYMFKRKWITKAYTQASKIIIETGAGTVISESLPFENHQVAEKIKKAMSIKWISYILDPYSENDNCKGRSILFKSIAGKIEKKVYKQCDRVYVFPEIVGIGHVLTGNESNITIIGMPYLKDKGNKQAVYEPADMESIDLVFAGTFLPGIRTGNDAGNIESFSPVITKTENICI